MALNTQVTAGSSPRTAPALGRRPLLAGAAVIFVIAAVLLGPAVLRIVDDPAGSAPVTGVDSVQIRDSRFEPPAIEVAAGSEVTWAFDDGGVAHNVVGDGWGSEVLESGTFTRTFAEPGSYSYACTLHWGMEGRVDVVQP